MFVACLDKQLVEFAAVGISQANGFAASKKKAAQKAALFNICQPIKGLLACRRYCQQR